MFAVSVFGDLGFQVFSGVGFRILRLFYGFRGLGVQGFMGLGV